jgi:hypothetical protein
MSFVADDSRFKLPTALIDYQKLPNEPPSLKISIFRLKTFQMKQLQQTLPAATTFITPTIHKSLQGYTKKPS